MELLEVIENLKYAIEEKDWDSVKVCVDTLESIQESGETDLNVYFQDEEY